MSMGTRSVVAVPTQSGGWRGRYVHWDGYPIGVGLDLYKIVMRDGRTVACKRLMEDRYGWSTINLEQRDEPLQAGMNDGRFVNEPGYGIAYTTEQGQSSPTHWVTDTNLESWCEWAYVIQPTELEIWVHDDVWAKVGAVEWGLDDQEAHTRFETVEILQDAKER